MSHFLPEECQQLCCDSKAQFSTGPETEGRVVLETREKPEMIAVQPGYFPSTFQDQYMCTEQGLHWHEVTFKTPVLQ